MHIGVLAEIFELRLLVIGIYGHSHRTDLRTCIKKCEPVRYITCPYSHMGTSFDSYCKETLGHVVYTFIEPAPCKTEIAVRIDYILFVRGGFGPMFKPVTESPV